MVLEMVGDLPDADAKPPSNMLFVCKLNPVTSEEDLEIIFARCVRLSDGLIQKRMSDPGFQIRAVGVEVPGWLSAVTSEEEGPGQHPCTWCSRLATPATHSPS